MIIGNKIKELRNNSNITQEELAKALMVSTQAVSKWENGGSPDLELVPEIAKYFNVTTDYLFGLSINDYKDFEVKVANYLSNISQEDKFNKMQELGYFMIRGSFNESDYSRLGVDDLVKSGGTNSQMIDAYGIALSEIKNEGRFFAVFPKADNGGYSHLIKKEVEQRELFKALANEDFYQAVVLLNTRKNLNFTEKLLIKELNITEERANEIIGQLIKFKLLNVSELELDDEKNKIYSLYDNPALIGFLTFANMLVKRPNSFCYSMTNSNGQYFKKEK